MMSERGEVDFERCKEFLVAMLVRAIQDLDYIATTEDTSPAAIPTASVTVREKTRQWFLSNDDTEINTFCGMCNILELDPIWFRRRYKKKLNCVNKVIDGKIMRIQHETEVSDSYGTLPRHFADSGIKKGV